MDSLYLVFIGLALVYLMYKNISVKRKALKILRDYSSRLGWSKYKIEDLDSHYLERKDELGKWSLDALTWGDLELSEFLIKTQAFYSSLGANHIYEAFHYLADESTLEWRKKLIDMGDQDREICITHLYYLGKEDGSNLHFFIRNAGDFFLPFWLIQGLYYLMILTIISIPFIKAWSLILAGGLIIVNSLIYTSSQEKLRHELFNVDYFQKALKRARLLEKELSEDLVWYKKELGGNLEAFKGIRVSPLQETGESIEFQAFKDISNIFFLKSLRQYARLGHRVKKNRLEATRLVELLGELELALYMKALIANKAMCQAEFSGDKLLSFEELYHPVLDEPVGYSRQASKRLLVTGSNASGKSTFMKSMAISSLFSQVVGYAFAKSFSLSPGRIYTSMALRDSLEKEESYFVTEIKSLRRIVKATEEGFCCCFIDEILRGTNTIERIAASSSVLERLAESDSCIYVATHDIELTELLSAYENVHFREHYEGSDIVFDYKLLEGPSDSTNAILLLGIMGFNQEIIGEAQAKVDNFLATKTWRKM